MAKQSFVSGDTPEAKFKSIDIVLNRLARKQFHYATVAVPQIPIFVPIQSISDDGVLSRILIPMAGTIKKAYMYVESVGEKVKPVLTISLAYEKGTLTESFDYKVGSKVWEKDISVPALARIVISTTEAKAVSGVSLGLVFEPTMASLTKEKILVDRIISAMEADDASKTEEGTTA